MDHRVYRAAAVAGRVVYQALDQREIENVPFHETKGALRSGRGQVLLFDGARVEGREVI